MSGRTEVHTHEGSLRDLSSGLDRILERADKKRATFSFDVITDEDRISHEADKPMFAASLGKLPVAVIVAEDYADYAGERLRVHSSDVAQDGAGHLDHAYATTQNPQYPLDVPVTYLVEDMLGLSGNTPFRVLTHDRADELQNRYRKVFWNNTTVTAVANGRVEIGTTTPEEALDQISVLELLSQQGNKVAQAAARGLANIHDTTHGIGPFLTEEDAVRRKLGRYNGDPEDPGIFRHEVALIAKDKRVVNYAFMLQTATASPYQKQVANGLLLAASGEVAKYLGLRRPRLLGLRALTF